ncbi:SRPBCC domain-containing protein [Candidatus Peregrinibacteria bacterium]|nr:SRPBCC domain-containing protein [Candidatus Peregrinibacteria bacterium]
MVQNALVITRTFDAPREQVWKAWTDPDIVKKWWGPAEFTCPVATIDLRVGGTYLSCMRSTGAIEQFPKGQEFWSTGTYTEIVPMKRIVVSDHFCDSNGNVISPKDVGMPGQWPDEMIVTVTFEDMGDNKTKLTLEHAGHPKEMMENATTGWNQSLDKFAAALR